VYSVDIDSLDAAMAQDPSLFDISHISDNLLTKESGKVVFLIGLLNNLRSENHRCLIFSASRRMLDIVQKVMKNLVSDLTYLRPRQDTAVRGLTRGLANLLPVQDKDGSPQEDVLVVQCFDTFAVGLYSHPNDALNSTVLRSSRNNSKTRQS